MKHPVHRHARHQGSEWISAVFTLLVLIGIYNSTGNFDSYSALITQKTGTTEKKITVATPYWNDNFSYGFRSVEGDTYSNTGSSHFDQVIVSHGDVIKSSDGTVMVTFYKDTPIETIEQVLPPDSPRAYSRLPNGIAVIEGDLDSPSAKTILSTLHSR